VDLLKRIPFFVLFLFITCSVVLIVFLIHWQNTPDISADFQTGLKGKISWKPEREGKAISSTQETQDDHKVDSPVPLEYTKTRAENRKTRVSGGVYSNEGIPLAEAQVILEKYVCSAVFIYAKFNTDAEGMFEFLGFAQK